MSEEKQNKRELFDRLPPEWPEDLFPAIQERVRQAKRKVIVLDDDPTGTQTVHGVHVLTEWPITALEHELQSSDPAFYLLTNSRSLPYDQAHALNNEIGARLRQAGQQTGRDFVVISRSDSTLRGHFPGEVAALALGLQTSFDAWILAPFFPEGGRYTLDDIHYVAEGDWLVPAGQTEFARDKAFGYNASNLREWIIEKMGVDIQPEQIAAASIADLRQGGPQAVTRKLLALPKGAICFTNAASYRDLEVFVLGLLEAEALGRRYLYRTAAAFVRVRAGIAARPLLQPESLLPDAGSHPAKQSAGLVIAGSYVPKTSEQLDVLLQQTKIRPVEVNVSHLLDNAARDAEIEQAGQAVQKHLMQGEDAVLFTSRELISAESAEQNLAIGRAVSDGLVAILHKLEIRPSYVLAKGGITSSDIATDGLGIRRARVLGQILPGVPVWECGPESRFPGLTYIVFPGNVGEPDALARIVKQMAARA